MRGKAVDVLWRRLWGWRGSVQREGQAPRPTKSEWDSAENLIDGGIGSNPHRSWLGLTEQQNLTLFRGREWMPEVERPKF